LTEDDVYSNRKGSGGESMRDEDERVREIARREERRDSGVRDVVEKSLISLGQRRRWNSSNCQISYHERVTTLDI